MSITDPVDGVGGAARRCVQCGKPVTGRRKYHSECAGEVRAANAVGYSRKYRARASASSEAASRPARYTAGGLSVAGLVLSSLETNALKSLLAESVEVTNEAVEFLDGIEPDRHSRVDNHLHSQVDETQRTVEYLLERVVGGSTVRGTGTRSRMCAECGGRLTSPKERRYHVRCAEVVRERRAADYSRRYRSRKAVDAGLPETVAAALAAGRAAPDTGVTTRGVVLMGRDVVEVHAALTECLMTTLRNDRYLRSVLDTDRTDGHRHLEKVTDVTRRAFEEVLGLLPAVMVSGHQNRQPLGRIVPTSRVTNPPPLRTLVLGRDEPS